MIEEAEKNASSDKSKKALVMIIYEYDNLLAKAEVIERTPDFTNVTKERARTLFRKTLKLLKLNYKRNNLKGISTVLEEDYLSLAFEAVLFSVIESKIKKGKFSKSSIIDVTDETIDS
jgi:hypothetical protein